LAVSSDHRRTGRQDPSLVGRAWEMSALAGILETAIGGSGCVAGIVGPPGIGKSRIVREVAVLAQRRDVEVFAAYCESHASEIPFYAVTSLLRTTLGVAGLDDELARTRVRERTPDADPQDLLLLDDLLGIRDSSVELPTIDPDARRRRLTRLANTVSLARTTAVVYIVEDAHWIDDVSESLLADFLTVIPQTPSLVLITYRPEYRGALTRTPNSQTITLAPLNAAQTSALAGELVGSHPSVTQLAAQVAERSAGNPFFAEDIVRDLAERGVLAGGRGQYVCHIDRADVAVPATLQATIAARIDRLEPVAKHILNAAAVIGLRFSADQLALLDGEAEMPQLVDAELIDQVRFTPRAEYAFHHPLIRAVAYESQLKSSRAELHRRLATAIQQDNLSADENAALIAEHLEAAVDLGAAFDWHMRAGAWAQYRDIRAARLSWERARQVADRLPADNPDRTSMRIAPRTLLCGSTWRVSGTVTDTGFDELRDLCAVAGDKLSLAIGMAGLPGWKEDLNQGFGIARTVDATSYSAALLWKYGFAVHVGALLPDAAADRDTAEALETAEHSGDDFAVEGAGLGRGIILVYQDGSRRSAGLVLLAQWREAQVRHGYAQNAVRIIDTEFAKEKARLGDVDSAIQLARAAVDYLFDAGEMITRGAATSVLVESLLQRGSNADLKDAQAAIERLAAVPTDPGFVLFEIPLLRLRALMARANGDENGYREFVDRYRKRANDVGYERHIAVADAMAQAM
jgi:AAA ATPase-like protein